MICNTNYLDVPRCCAPLIGHTPQHGWKLNGGLSVWKNRIENTSMFRFLFYPDFSWHPRNSSVQDSTWPHRIQVQTSIHL